MSDFWTIQDYLEARKPGNEAMLVMINCYFDGSKRIEDAPDEALTHFARGRVLAQELNKPWWMLFFDHWKLQALMFGTRDYNEAYDLAIKATVDARKPETATCPTRICIHEDLILVYQVRDPIGYADMIEDAIRYMECEVTDKSNCRMCLQSRRISLELALDRIDNATDSSMQFLSMTEKTKHYRIHALGNLSDIAYRKEDWQMLFQWAKAGEPLAQEENRREWVAIFLAWQTFALHKLGHEEEAAKYLHMVQRYTEDMNAMQSGSYYDALCGYYESVDDLWAALRLRETQVNLYAGTGRYYSECRYRLKQCHLLVKLGQSIDNVLPELRAVAAKLLKPDKILAEIEQLTSGNNL